MYYIIIRTSSLNSCHIFLWLKRSGVHWNTGMLFGYISEGYVQKSLKCRKWLSFQAFLLDKHAIWKARFRLIFCMRIQANITVITTDAVIFPTELFDIYCLVNVIVTSAHFGGLIISPSALFHFRHESLYKYTRALIGHSAVFFLPHDVIPMGPPVPWTYYMAGPSL